jgi:hypothetical protein
VSTEETQTFGQLPATVGLRLSAAVMLPDKLRVSTLAKKRTSGTSTLPSLFAAPACALPVALR